MECYNPRAEVPRSWGSSTGVRMRRSKSFEPPLPWGWCPPVRSVQQDRQVGTCCWVSWVHRRGRRLIIGLPLMSCMCEPLLVREFKFAWHNLSLVHNICLSSWWPGYFRIKPQSLKEMCPRRGHTVVCDCHQDTVSGLSDQCAHIMWTVQLLHSIGSTHNHNVLELS